MTDITHRPRGGIDPSGDPIDTSPTELAEAIAGSADIGDIGDIAPPPSETGLSLADVDGRHDSYQQNIPVLRQLPSPPPAAHLSWLAADRRLADARDKAHDGAGDVRAAEAKDRANALNAARNGGKLSKPTAPAAAAAAVEAVRRFDAAITLATEALNQVGPALRQVWPTWRRQLIANIDSTTARAEAALVELEAALLDRSGAVSELLAVDKLYGEGRPGEIVEHQPPHDVHPALWSPPASNGVAVAQLLGQGPSLSANADAWRVPDLRDVRRMLSASTLNEEWTPTGDGDGDGDSPPAA